jgi:hypothetical protein
VAGGVLRRPFSRGEQRLAFAVHRSAHALGEAFWEGVKTVYKGSLAPICPSDLPRQANTKR